jgi:polysaccharide deacetylase 2 family uncharacterized protein YibQ
MENIDNSLKHEGQLEIGMSPAKIEALTFRALDFVPGAVGVNNHMGSRFTADSFYIGLFMDAIDDLPLYFVDSRTTADSHAYEAARDAGIPTAYRHVFLDHDNDAEAIRKSFQGMVELAEQQGDVVAIAHFRPNTADALAELLPTLKDAEIELTPMSELVE